MFRSYDLEGVTVIVPEGELDVTNSMEFKNRVLDDFVNSGKTRIILDMSNVGYMDSSALGIIISLFKNCRMNGGSLALAGLVDSVRRLFSITALDKVVPIYESVEEAVKKMK